MGLIFKADAFVSGDSGMHLCSSFRFKGDDVQTPRKNATRQRLSRMLAFHATNFW
jgi:hypothetical protein